jgi:hypothetical protein
VRPFVVWFQSSKRHAFTHPHGHCSVTRQLRDNSDLADSLLAMQLDDTCITSSAEEEALMMAAIIAQDEDQRVSMQPLPEPAADRGLVRARRLEQVFMRYVISYFSFLLLHYTLAH